MEAIAALNHAGASVSWQDGSSVTCRDVGRFLRRLPVSVELEAVVATSPPSDRSPVEMRDACRPILQLTCYCDCNISDTACMAISQLREVRGLRIDSCSHTERERAQRVSPCMLVQRDARGIEPSRGEGRAQRGTIVVEMGSITSDRRGEAQTGSASARRPSRSRNAADAEHWQMTTALEAIDFEEEPVPRITVHADLRRRAR